MSKDPSINRALNEIKILASLIADYSTDDNATFYANKILKIFKAIKIFESERGE